MAAYYNDQDRFVAAWLRELIAAGLIADGDVDERPIEDVTANDVKGYRQAHWFAGIGGWSYALRLAGWPDDRPVWTGSCPCQPFSSAGKGDGAADPRHLWPTWFRLIRECGPHVVFGEQVASAGGLGWFDRVSTDLEGAGYAVGAADLGAASVGAFHIRQRLWFVADAEGARGQQDARPIRTGQTEGLRDSEGKDERRSLVEAGRLVDCGTACQLADADGRHAVNGHVQRGGEYGLRAEDRCPDGHTGDGERPEGRVANAAHAERLYEPRNDGRDGSHSGRPEAHGQPGARREVRKLGDATRGGLGINGRTSRNAGHADESIEALDLGNAIGAGLQEQRGDRGVSRGTTGADAGQATVGASASTSDMGIAYSEREATVGGVPVRPAIERSGSPWASPDWIACRDGKARPTQSGLVPLVARLPSELVPSGDPSAAYANATAEARVMRLRGYGNSIVPQVAQVFIEWYMRLC